MSEDCCSTNQDRKNDIGTPLSLTARKTYSQAGCPQCLTRGKPVEVQTVKALISVPLNLVENTQYYFCSAQLCPIVYFSADGKSSFSKDQLREKVYQKDPNADGVFLCYCFRLTAAEIRNAAPEQQASLVDAINVGIRAGQCACDLRNPQGSCCLGNVRELIKK